MALQSQFGFTAPQLRDAGISLASESAEGKNPGWNEKAYGFVIEFLKHNKRFMMEDARQFAYSNGLPTPRTDRSWGGVALRLKSQHLIICIGKTQTKGASAHCANAAVWERNDERMIEMDLM